jgi:hypothetical protein
MSQSKEGEYILSHKNGKYSAIDAIEIASGSEMRRVGYEGLYIENAGSHRFLAFTRQSGLKTDLVNETITFGEIMPGSQDLNPTKPSFTFDINRVILQYVKTKHVLPQTGNSSF